MLGKLVDCHPDLRIILSSRNEQIEIPAEIAPYICILNFNVTYSGFIGKIYLFGYKRLLNMVIELEQLLSAAINQEKPDLETRRKQLLHENEELQEKLHYLQSRLLDCLTNSDGNILNNKVIPLLLK